MNHIYTCLINGHEEEPIIGLCLDQTCKQKAQYCNECLSSHHSHHNYNCKSMIKLKQIVKTFHSQICDWIKYIEQEYQKLQKSYQSTLKHLTNQKNLMLELEQNMQNEEFQQLTQNVQVLKALYQTQESKRDIKSNNFQDILIKMNEILQTLDQQEIQIDIDPVQKNVNPGLQVNQIEQQKEQEIVQLSEMKVNQGISLNLNGKYVEAIIFLDEAIKINYFNSSAHREKGQVCFKIGFALIHLTKYEEALESLNEAIILDEKNAVPYYLKGLTLYKLHDLKKAIKYYDYAILLDSKYTSAYVNKGQILIELELYEEVIKSCDSGIKQNPKSINLYEKKGIALYNLKRYDKAIQCYDQILKLDPKSVHALSRKGNLLRQINKYEEALQYLNQALAIDPNHINILYTKGQTLGEMKLYEEAIECYDQVLKLDPNHTDAKQSKDIIRTAVNLKDMYNNMKFIN